MRSTTVLSALFAAGALGHAIKRDVVYITDVEVATAVVTVDASGATVAPAAPAPAVPAPAAPEEPHHHHHHHHKHHHHHHHKSAAPALAPAPVPEPVPTPSPVPVAAPEPVHHHKHHKKPAAAAAAPAPAPVVQNANSYEGVGVQQHNLHRANHSAPGLSWDSDLAQSAAALAAGCVFEHNVDLGPASSYGQNIASSSPATGSTADELKKVITDMWYDGEVNYFSGLYGAPTPDQSLFDSYGHFTQVVWKGTQKVGCATQNCPSMGYFTVCNYFPAGNMMGTFNTNVLPSQDEASISF